MTVPQFLLLDVSTSVNVEPNTSPKYFNEVAFPETEQSKH